MLGTRIANFPNSTQLLSYLHSEVAALPHARTGRDGEFVSNQAWLDALRNAISRHGGDGYYGDAMEMLFMIVVSGDWWTPDLMSAPCAG